MLFLGVAFSLFAAASAPAQMDLQGRSQYGGLIRNVNSGKCVDVYGDSTNRGANVQQYACNGGGNQRWEFIALGGGQFAIRNVNSGMVLDVYGNSREDGETCNSTPGTEAGIRDGAHADPTAILSW
jgi:hypothetical protein